MSNIKQKGDRHPYAVRDEQCIGRECLNLHAVALRNAAPGGSRTTGYIHCCARREYQNCPIPLPAFDRKLAAERRREGMRNA